MCLIKHQATKTREGEDIKLHRFLTIALDGDGLLASLFYRSLPIKCCLNVRQGGTNSLSVFLLSNSLLKQI